jgi:hypothetical protein
LQSIPLLPINLHAAKLWVEIDGRDISKMNRQAAGTDTAAAVLTFHNRHSRIWFASVMYDRCTYIPWSPHTSRNGSHCARAAIRRHALEVFIDLPKPQVSACVRITHPCTS